MPFIDEVYADVLSDADSNIDSESDSDSDSGSDNVVRRYKNTGRPLISDSESDEETSLSKDWTEVDFTPDFHTCLEPPGIHPELPSAKLDIISCVNLFLSADLFNLFVAETNVYYYQHNSDNVNDSKKNKAWIDTDVTEMKKFLGLILIMGIVKKSERDDYWSTHPLLHTPIFGNTMTRNRFRQLWKYWHFSNNDCCHERLDKIKPVSLYLVDKFKRNYKPEKELLLVESIIPWKGRPFFRTYKPEKFIKHGILIHMVCEATTGYICNLEIYCAQEKSLNTTIYSVLSPYLNLWHDVYIDNYYNSVKIAEELLKHKTNMCGTIRKNRGAPHCLTSKTFKNKTTEFRRKGKILVQTWNSGKRLVTMISTIHSANMVECINKRTKKKIIKPICVWDYNKYMKGVDRTDQYLSKYSILLQTKKWAKKTVLYLINCSLFNAYQVYIKNSKNSMKFKEFLLNVASLWIGANETEPESAVRCNKRSTKYDPPDRLSADMRKHKIINIIGNGRIENPRRACKVCSAAKKRSSTSFMCSSCSVPLHAGKCFEIYHTKEKF